MVIMRLMIWIVSVFCACAHGGEAPRAVVSRTTLPDQVRDLLPRHGAVVWIAGGEGSLFVTFDRDARTLRTRTVRPASADVTSARTLTAAQSDRLWALADKAWREPRPPPHEPHLDHDEVLAIGDGDDAFLFDGNGSIETPAGAAAVKAMVDASR